MRSLPGPVKPPAPRCQPQPLVHCTLPAPMGSDRDTFIPTLPMGKSEAQRGAQGPRVLWQQSGAPPGSPAPRQWGARHIPHHTWEEWVSLPGLTAPQQEPRSPYGSP